MSSATLRTDRILVIALGILVVGGAAWGWAALSLAEPAAPLPESLSADALKAAAEEDPGKAMQRVREAFENQDLSEAQREQLRDNAREVRRAFMETRLNEYFEAPEEEQVAILDRHLDEFMARGAEWRQRRGERAASRPAGRPTDRPVGQATNRPAGQGASAQSGPPSGPPGPQGRRGPRTPPTREQRKVRSESRSPDRRARHMAYRTAMQKRAKERGLEMPGRGGPGGGRGGPR